MGVCTSTVLTSSYDLTLKVGEQAQAGPWKVSLQRIAVESASDGSDDVVIRGEVSCVDSAGSTWVMSPGTRRLLATDQTMADVAIRSTLSGDCFVALGDWNDSTGSVGVHVASLPGVVWIWIGAALTSVGGLLCTIHAVPRAVAAGDRSTVQAGEPLQETLALPSAGAQS
jgi:cytochrome c biogenesis factor